MYEPECMSKRRHWSEESFGLSFKFRSERKELCLELPIFIIKQYILDKNIKIIISQIDFNLKLICLSPLQVELSTPLVRVQTPLTSRILL